jgi:hypothetical protein
MMRRFRTPITMAGLGPATQPASVSERNESCAPADAGVLGGRLKGGHGEVGGVGQVGKGSE